MNNYQELLSTLLSQETEFNQNNLFLSAYIPTGYDLRQDLYTHCKSLIQTALRKSDLIKHKEKHNEIVNLILQTLENKDVFLEGLAVFVEINLINSLSLESVQVADLINEPKEDVFIGMTYDVDQLIDAMNRNPSAIILNIKRKQTQVYSLRNKVSNHLVDLENEFVYGESQVHLERYSPTRQTSIVHLTGGKNLQESAKAADYKYIKSITKSLKKVLQGQDFQYLVVFYSKYFENTVDYLTTSLRDSTGIKSILKSINITTEEDLVRKAWKVLMEKIDINTTELIEKAQENREMFMTDWSDIASNIRAHRVSHLFLLPGAKKEGYIDKEGDVYLDNADDRIKVDNIVPWLVKKAVETSVQIVIIQNNSKIKSQAAIFLRY